MLTETLNSENNFSVPKSSLPKSISNIEWTSKIPIGATLRVEYENLSFIDIKNEGDELSVSYSATVYGEDGGHSTIGKKDMLGETTNTFKKKFIFGGIEYDN